jgi:catechol 2,3-dioxygenase-like lactoylglutathione lyase family enzyme
VTLGVSDLERARAFYEALGWSSGASPGADVVFFQAGGMIVALWDRARLAEDSEVEDAGGWGGITLAYNTRSPAEVDAVIEEARAAGAEIRREPAETFWGRLLGGLHRSERPPVGDRVQPALDDPQGRLRELPG